ncbi:MAG: fasciclin domain-containing protein, partial [Prevotella sp.]|nr:fasciclin domain-containing protein [Prevotella sp.]
SVSFPALINRNMKIIDWAITQCKYNVYLNALGSDYSFFIPTNNALIEYIDPCSFGKPNLQLLSFRWDENKTNINERVYAVLYNYDEKTGERDSIGTVTNWNRITRCLQDILDTHIVIGKVWEGDHTYFRTKNGTGIRITNPKDESKMQVEGSYQMYEGQPLNVTRVYDQRKEVAGGNGKSYVLEGQPIMGTRLTVYDQLAAHPKYFGKFLELLEGSPLLETKHDMGTGDPNQDKACGGTNISVFNTYHYTIYVPDNEAIEQLQKEGKLSSWEEVDEDHQAGNEEKAASDSLNIVNFLKYHIQDNALYIGAQNESGDFETSLINKKTRRFYMVKSQLKDDEIEVLDAVDQQNMRDGVATTKHTVKKISYIDDDGIQRDLYNIQAREYMYNNNDALTATELYTTSSAVIHLIDKPLSYSTDD